RPPGGGDGGAPAPDRAAGVRGRRARGDRAAARARAGAAGLTRRKAATIAAFASLLPAASAADRRLRAVDQGLVVVHRAGRDAGRGDHAGEADEAVLGRGQGACATGAGGAHHGRHLDGVHARGGVFDDRAVGEADRGAAALADHDPLAGLDGLAGGGRDELAAGAGHDRAVDLHRADGFLRERGGERGSAEEGGGGRGAEHGLHGVFLVYWGLFWGATGGPCGPPHGAPYTNLARRKARTPAGGSKLSVLAEAQNCWNTACSGTPPSSSPGARNRYRAASERTSTGETRRRMCSGPSSSGPPRPQAHSRSRSACRVFWWKRWTRTPLSATSSWRQRRGSWVAIPVGQRSVWQLIDWMQPSANMKPRPALHQS